MLKRIFGTIGCLALLALGTAILSGMLTIEELRAGVADGTRERFLRPMLASSIEAIGAMTTGGITILLGLLLLFTSWQPEPKKVAA